MKTLLVLMLFGAISAFAQDQIDRNCVGDGFIPGKSKKNTEPLRASFEFDDSHIYVQVFGDDFDTMAIDYSFDRKSISKQGKVIGRIIEPELLKMESEGSLNMKDLAVIEIILPSASRAVASLQFSEHKNKKHKGAIFKGMECEEQE